MKQITLALVAVALAGGSLAGAQDEAADSARRVRDRMASTRISLDFSGARLSEVIAYFQEYSGLNFHLDQAAAASKEDDRVTLRLKDVSMMTALKLILRPRELGCVYRDGVLFIASKAQLGSQTVTRVYDIRDLVFKLADFPGPKFELSPTFSGLDPSSLIQDEPKEQFTEETLIDLIKANTGDRSWDDSSVSSIQQVNGLLVISQSRPIQEEVRRLLDLLRQYK